MIRIAGIITLCLVCNSFGADSINTVLYDKPLMLTQSLTDSSMSSSAHSQHPSISVENERSDTLRLSRIATADNKKKPGKAQKFFVQYREHVVFSGLCLGTAFTAWMFDIAARRQYEREQDAYEKYKLAEQGSDFGKLWDSVEDEREKTDKHIQKRNVFGIAAGAVGVSLFWSFAIERD